MAVIEEPTAPLTAYLPHAYIAVWSGGEENVLEVEFHRSFEDAAKTLIGWLDEVDSTVPTTLALIVNTDGGQFTLVRNRLDDDSDPELYGFYPDGRPYLYEASITIDVVLSGSATVTITREELRGLNPLNLPRQLSRWPRELLDALKEKTWSDVGRYGLEVSRIDHENGTAE